MEVRRGMLCELRCIGALRHAELVLYLFRTPSQTCTHTHTHTHTRPPHSHTHVRSHTPARMHLHAYAHAHTYTLALAYMLVFGSQWLGAACSTCYYIIFWDPNILQLIGPTTACSPADTLSHRGQGASSGIFTHHGKPLRPTYI